MMAHYTLVAVRLSIRLGLSLCAVLLFAQPVPTQTQAFPLFSGGPAYLFLGKPLAEPGEWLIEAGLNWWNAFRYDFQQFSPYTTLVDAEGLAFHGLGMAQVLPGWDLGLRIEVHSLFAGLLDTPIESFHRWFSLPNQGREYVQQNQLRIVHQLEGFTFVERMQPSLEIRHASLWLRHHQSLSPGVWLTAQTSAKLPLPHLEWPASWASLGLGLGLEAEFIPGTLDAGGALGLVLAGPRSLLDSALLQVGTHWGWQILPQTRLVARLDLQHSPYPGPPTVSSGLSGNLLVGVLWEVVEGGWVFLGLQEEGLTWASVEVGFLVSLLWTSSRPKRPWSLP